MGIIQHIFIGTLASMIVFASGCDESGSTRIVAGAGSGVAGTGSAAQGGTVNGGLVWGDSLNRWPKDGNSQFVAGDSVIRSSFDLWLDSRQPPRMPDDEGVVKLLNDLRAFNMPLTDLNGDWGVPPKDVAIRTQAIRGIGKTLWADLRLALIEDDQDRVVEVIRGDGEPSSDRSWLRWVESRAHRDARHRGFLWLGTHRREPAQRRDRPDARAMRAASKGDVLA